MGKLGPSLRADNFELLRAKLAIPLPRQPFVARPELLARFDRALNRKLTLVSAPPGFGKTTLLAQWIASRSQQAGAPRVAWVSLDRGDNDPVRFWRYAVTACQLFDPNIGTAALDLFDRPQRPAYEVALTSLINDLTGLPGKRVLVLEDYHVLETQQVHETVAYLLDHLPPGLHLIITTRQDPPLPLPRLRVRNELLEVGARDLRFSLEETQAFLSQAVRAELSPETVGRLAERTEGWAAGLRLVALALEGKQHPDDIERAVADLAGSHKHIVDYLTAEVLNSQPDPIRDFLLRTSVLSRLTGPLCDAVTGRDDGAEMLQQLETANLFIDPLDAAHTWYRYHSLFAEAMQQEAAARLGSGAVGALYERAACWFEQHGELSDAVEAAIAGGLYPRAAALIERIVQEAPHFAIEVYTLRRWLDALPQRQLHNSGLLCFMYATAILYSSDRYAPDTRAGLEAPLRAAEELWRSEGNDGMVGRVIAFRSLVDWWQGDYAASFARIKEALPLLPIHDTEWRGTCTLGLGVEALLAGEMEAAGPLLLEARDLLGAAGNTYGYRAAVQILGLMYLRQGRLHQASELFEEVLQQAGKELSDRAQALAGLAETAYERGELQQARQLAAEALDLSRQVHECDAWVSASLTLARASHAQGETAPAEQVVQRLVTQARGSPLAGDVELAQAWITYAKGDLALAERLSAHWESDAGLPWLLRERRGLLTARLLIARGEAEEALRQLAPWLEQAVRQGRHRSDIEILVLQALAWSAQHRRAQATQALVHALQLAQPEGHKRVFLDEGERLVALLKESLSQVHDASLLAFARALLATYAQEQADAKPSSEGDLPPVEALSVQERRVMRLLAAGRTYHEIARELVVSINTVKTQIKSIYRKLGVANREEAEDVARHLKLN